MSSADNSPTESNTPGHSSREQQLQQQYDEIASLAGGLAHEIRNPLSTIRMNLNLLFEDLEENEAPFVQRIQRKLATIQTECFHLEEILEAFLQFARAGELYLEQVDLGEEVRQFLNFYQAEADQHQIEVRPHLPTDLPLVKIDKRLMRQVLVNLVQNAQQAMPHGGVLEVQAALQQGQVVLQIIDTGSGIAAAARENMFEVFFSTKPTGSGLGLPTARKIVEAHGGTITCDSEPNHGTRFTITLPLSSL